MNKESKRERFVRVTETRTNKILGMIRLLGNCSNRMTYEYSEEDIEKIFGTIEKEIENTKSRFLDKGFKKFTLN